MAQHAGVRPFGERRLADETRPDPVRVPPEWAWWEWVERARALCDGIQLSAQVEREHLREPRADPTRVDQAISVVSTYEQGPKPGPRSFRVGEAADHEQSALKALRLPPGVAASGLIRQIPTFGDDALEAEAACFVEERVAAPVDVIGVADPSGLVVTEQLEQPRLSLLEWPTIDAFAVETQKVEGKVDERRARDTARSCLLQRLEARTTIRLQHHQLAVDHGVFQAELLRSLDDFRERGRPVLAVTADQPDAAAGNQAADAVAIELDFVQPLVTRRR